MLGNFPIPNHQISFQKEVLQHTNLDIALIYYPRSQMQFIQNCCVCFFALSTPLFFWPLSWSHPKSTRCIGTSTCCSISISQDRAAGYLHCSYWSGYRCLCHAKILYSRGILSFSLSTALKSLTLVA
jgi:hypothetical protein